MVTLTMGNSDIECPPEDTYTVKFVQHSDIQQMENSFKPGQMKNVIYLSFVIVDREYDPEFDERDWNGFEIRELFTVSLSERARLYPFVKALRGGGTIEEGEDVEIGDLIGKTIKATINKSEKGWPKLDAPIPARRQRPKSQPEANQEPNAKPMTEDDELKGTAFDRNRAA